MGAFEKVQEDPVEVVVDPSEEGEDIRQLEGLSLLVVVSDLGPEHS